METIDRHRDLVVFVQVAELGGFGKAAAALGISTSQASRSIARLEDRLGTRLMTRTTRRVALTEAGRALHERAGRLLADLDEAEASVRDATGEPRGVLRVTLPVHFGLRYLAPLVAEFAEAWPALHVEAAYDDYKVDLVQDGYDLAVRIGDPVDASLVARRLGSTRAFTVASPAYLERHGTPARPQDLTGHVGLANVRIGNAPWRFLGPEGEVGVRVPTRFTSNNGAAICGAAVRGLGIARLPDFIAGDELRAGRLVRILEAWEQQLPMAAVYPPGRHLSPKVRRFVDFLVERLADQHWSRCTAQH